MLVYFSGIGMFTAGAPIKFPGCEWAGGVTRIEDPGTRACAVPEAYPLSDSMSARGSLFVVGFKGKPRGKVIVGEKQPRKIKKKHKNEQLPE